MKTRCSCCGSKRLRRQGRKDKEKFEEGAKLGNIYECLDCGMTDVFDVEDCVKEKSSRGKKWGKENTA